MLKKTTISILEGTPLYRTLLTRMISSIDGYELVSVYQDVESAHQLLLQPSDVVVIDQDTGNPDKIMELMRRLNGLGSVSVIACSMQEDEILLRRVFSVGGVIGFIVKHSAYDEFRSNMMLAMNGGMPISRSIVRRLVNIVRHDFPKPPAHELSANVSLACQLINEVLSLPFSHNQENLSDFLSRRIGLSYHQLSLQFKKEMGINLSHFVIMQRIEKVKGMIREGKFSLSQIANMMDYSSVAHLSAQFRKTTGFTPSEFKRTLSFNR
jgi:AraC-like DNA-binding protein/DNA-binding NarL/FixJ family response regulator